MINKKLIYILFFCIFSALVFGSSVSGQTELESANYKILDLNIDSGGGVIESQSGDYSTLFTVGGTIYDERLESSSYNLGLGFPNGIQANLPLIRCAETNTTAVTPSECLNFPNGDGAIGECGNPGCYDRMKIEIDHQNNPIDTLYLIVLTDISTNIVYYVQSDHTIDTTYDITDYMTICEFEGIDTRSGSGCENSSDPEWDEALQSTNVYNLTAGTTYNVQARALNGDFTESGLSPLVSATTELPTLVLDIDTGSTSTVENSGPHNVNLGSLLPGQPTTGDQTIYLDMATNIRNGQNTFIRSLFGFLNEGTGQIPSQSEDLSIDPGSDGGYGVKNVFSNQDSQGPIIDVPAFVTANTTTVGAVSTIDSLIFYTENSGPNLGHVNNGRGGLEVKAVSTTSTPAGSYTDTLIFTMTAQP